MMDRQGRGLSETVWTRLDRKAGAVTELTIRQLRNRLSTCLLYTSPSPRDVEESRMPSSA